MARVNLSSRLEKRIGKTTKNGTEITRDLVTKVGADEVGLIGIEQNNIQQFEEAMDEALLAALEEIGLAAERFAKLACPVDTGRLRNSITHALDASMDSVYVGSNVEYAPYVELGVHGREGKKMLTRAAEDHKEFYEGILKKHLGGA